MRFLSEYRVRPGERWVYSAGCNIGPTSKDTRRVDVEVADLRALASAGARVALLSHQGSAADGSALHLSHVADLLGARLGRSVGYVPDAVSPAALKQADAIRDGEIVLFGNTRLDPREERGDRRFARDLARLGDRVAIGGFSKAHRRHASNVGILEFLPGYATTGLIEELSVLRPWVPHPGSGTYAAVLGGVKPEKTLVGLAGLVGKCDLIVPGGVVLNLALAVRGYDIGDSERGPSPERCMEATRAALDGPAGDSVHLPKIVVVADRAGRVRSVPIADGVRPGWTIVDFEVEDRTLERLRSSVRALVAGSPGRRTDGAAAAILAARAADPSRTLLLGGDTVAELRWDGPVSTGGGSALHYLVDGRCAVVDALEENGRLKA